MQKLTYQELASLFRQRERSGGDHLTGAIVFTEDSFDQSYPIDSRTYVISSDNKAYRPNMGGYSIFGFSLDETDPFVRLDWYMKDEHGPATTGWTVDYCYLMEENA